MKATMSFRLPGLALILSCSILSAAPLDTNRIEHITGLKGAWNAAEGVFKVQFRRAQL
ncbi:MAG TPA: hypothetical protein VGK40_03265 [Verrucomicrobiae bacterium]|jgi:hypothetical protein